MAMFGSDWGEFCWDCAHKDKKIKELNEKVLNLQVKLQEMEIKLRAANTMRLKGKK